MKTNRVRRCSSCLQDTIQKKKLKIKAGVGVAKATTKLSVSLGGLTGFTLQSCLAKISYSERTHSKVSRGKDTRDNIRSHPGSRSPESCPSMVTRDVLNSSGSECAVLSTREAQLSRGIEGFPTSCVNSFLCKVHTTFQDVSFYSSISIFISLSVNVLWFVIIFISVCLCVCVFVYLIYKCVILFWPPDFPTDNISKIPFMSQYYFQIGIEQPRIPVFALIICMYLCCQLLWTQSWPLPG